MMMRTTRMRTMRMRTMMMRTTRMRTMMMTMRTTKMVNLSTNLSKPGRNAWAKLTKILAKDLPGNSVSKKLARKIALLFGKSSETVTMTMRTTKMVRTTKMMNLSTNLSQPGRNAWAKLTKILAKNLHGNSVSKKLAKKIAKLFGKSSMMVTTMMMRTMMRMTRMRVMIVRTTNEFDTRMTFEDDIEPRKTK